MAAKQNMAKELYEFGEFLVDASYGTLRRNGEIILLPPRVFDTLLLLVRRHGEVLTKREMLDEVWQEAFVEEGNLTQNIYLLRRTLGKAADGRDWIETMPRKGYVFVGEIRTPAETSSRLSQGDHRETKRTGVYSPVKIAFAALLLVGMVAAGFFVYSSVSRSAAGTGTNPEVGLQQLTFSGDIEFPVLAPDGHSFAFSKNGRIFIQSIGNDAVREIALPAKVEAGFLQFTPDGRFVSFRDQRRFYLTGDVYRVPIEGGEPTMVVRNVWGGFGFSPDGRYVSFVRDAPEKNLHSLVVHELNTGTERNLGDLTDPSRYIFIGSPAWSSTNTKIAIAVINHESKAPRTEMWVYDSATGHHEQLAPPQLKQVEQAVWLPGDDQIAVIGRENNKFFQVWKISYPAGKLARISNDLNIYRGLSLSADGRSMLAANYTIFSHLWVADALDLASQSQMTYGNLNRDGTIGLDWAKDESIIYTSRIFGNVDLWKVGPRDVDRKQLTREAGDVNSYPEMSPDESTVYFTSSRTGNRQIWKMDAVTGESQTQLTFGESEINEMPQISPDGGWLYYIKRAKQGAAIWRRSLTNGSEQPLEIEGKLSPTSFLALSPDGKLIATCHLTGKPDDNLETQRFQIAIIGTQVRQPIRFFDLPSAWIAWFPDGNAFDYADNRDGKAQVWRQGLDGTEARLIFEERSSFISRIGWKKDGSKVAISKGQRLNDAVLLTNF